MTGIPQEETLMVRPEIGQDVKLDSPLTTQERFILTGIEMGIWPTVDAGVDHMRKQWGWD